MKSSEKDVNIQERTRYVFKIIFFILSRAWFSYSATFVKKYNIKDETTCLFIIKIC